jgi:succinyl-CoA synthetase alpha subunit
MCSRNHHGGQINPLIKITEWSLDDFKTIITQEVLDQYETFYWKQYKECGFKIMNIREPGSRGRLSEITKFKIKEKRKFFRHTEESKLKMRRPRPNMVGKATKSVICVNNRKVYGSISEAAEKLNLKQGDISNVLIGNQNTTKGYKFIYEKKENSVIRR